jgi:lipopolysaccharide transport system permease protein
VVGSVRTESAPKGESGPAPGYPRGVDQLLNEPATGAAPEARVAQAETIRLEPTRGFSRLLSPGELWRYRDVAWQIAGRNLRVRYRQTALGALWAVLQPLLIMVVFTIIFGQLAHVSSDGLPYALFTLAALVPWTFFANAVQLGSDSLVADSALISKIYFPRLFIPAGVVAAGLVDFAIGFVILIVAVVIGGGHPSVGLLLLPVFVLMAIAAALGVATGLSAVNVRYRDVRYAVPFTVQLWLFLTPVAYSSTILPAPWQTLSAINPMVGVVEGFRWALLGRPVAPWALIGVSSASAVVLLIAGLWYFGRVERGFADIV